MTPNTCFAGTSLRFVRSLVYSTTATAIVVTRRRFLCGGSGIDLRRPSEQQCPPRENITPVDLSSGNLPRGKLVV